MKAVVRSIKNDFESYELNNIISVQYIRNILVLIQLNNESGVDTIKYSAGDVIVEIK